jgi:hypothetical protein
VRNGREALLITPTSKIYLSHCEIKENKAAVYLQGFNDTSPCNDLSFNLDTPNPDTRDPGIRTNGIETNGTNALYDRIDTSQSSHIEPLNCDHNIQVTPKPLDSLDVVNNLNMENNLNGEGRNDNVIIKKPEISGMNLIQGESIRQLAQDENISIEVIDDNSVSLLKNSNATSMSR